jgi:hypothetical protein
MFNLRQVQQNAGTTWLFTNESASEQGQKFIVTIVTIGTVVTKQVPASYPPTLGGWRG